MLKLMEKMTPKNLDNVVCLNSYRAARRDRCHGQTGKKTSITIEPGIEFLTGKSAVEALYARAEQEDTWKRLGDVCDQAIDRTNHQARSRFSQEK